jgi:hypothetical protein
MELPDFKNHTKMNALRKQMEAHYINVFDGRWFKADLSGFLSELLEKKEINVDFNQISIEDDESFSIGGQRVFTYVKRQRGGGKYKFHLANCATLKGAKNSRKFDKYVASIDTSGIFKVDILSGDNVYYDQEVELSVCRKCLQTLDYSGYRKGSKEERDQIYEAFDIDRFLNGKEVVLPSQFSKDSGFESSTQDSSPHLIRGEASELGVKGVIPALRKLIQEDDIASALNLVLDVLENEELVDYHSESIVLRKRNSQLRKEKRRKTITIEQFEARHNEIAFDFLDMLDDLETDIKSRKSI